METSEDVHMSLERMFLRIASAETDDLLERFLAKHLITAISIVSSQNQEVQNKAILLLSHINKRLKRNVEVQLPVDELISNLLQPEKSNLMQNFLIIYIKMGYGRLNLSKQTEILPKLFGAIVEKSENHQNDLLTICIPVLSQLDKRNVSSWPALNLDSQPHLRKLLTSFFCDLLLLPSARAHSLHSSHPAASSLHCRLHCAFCGGGHSPWTL